MAEIQAFQSTRTDEFWSQIIETRVGHIQDISLSDSKGVVEDARQLLDTELDGLHRAICRLRRRRNALSPVSCLPMELLSRIFQFSAAEIPPSRYNPTPPGPLGWIYVTHVCQRWREIALQPSLWTEINANLGPEWRMVFLARAQTAPLSMSIPHFEPDDIHLLLEHLYHTKTLILSTVPDILREALPSFISPAPILSSLELHTSLPGVVQSEKSVLLPSNIFSGNAPALRRVHLDGVSLSWTSPIFTNLIGLVVHHYHTRDPMSGTGSPSPDRTEPSSCDHLLDALSQMPNLVTLSLWRCLPERRPARKHTVALPHLKMLSIGGVPPECIDVIKHLQVPPSCRLSLRCDIEWVLGVQVPIHDLAPFFVASFRRTDEPPFRDLLILHDADNAALGFNFRRAPHAPDTDQRSVFLRFHTPEPDITIWFPLPQPDVGPLKTMCAMLPLDALRTLSVKVDPAGWSPDTWLAAFGRCGALEHVCLEGTIHAVHSFKALLRPADGGPEQLMHTTRGRRDELFLERLEGVTLSNADFLFVGGDPEEPYTKLLETLQICLLVRVRYAREATGPRSGEGNAKKADWRLEKLRISECSIRRKHVFNLADVVQEIVWDNDEGDYGPHEDTDEEEDSALDFE